MNFLKGKGGKTMKYHSCSTISAVVRRQVMHGVTPLQCNRGTRLIFFNLPPLPVVGLIVWWSSLLLDPGPTYPIVDLVQTHRASQFVLKTQKEELVSSRCSRTNYTKMETYLVKEVLESSMRWILIIHCNVLLTRGWTFVNLFHLQCEIFFRLQVNFLMVCYIAKACDEKYSANLRNKFCKI